MTIPPYHDALATLRRWARATLRWLAPRLLRAVQAAADGVGRATEGLRARMAARARGYSRQSRAVGRHFEMLAAGGRWTSAALADMAEDPWSDTGELPTVSHRTAAQETQLSFTDVDA